MQRHWRHDHGFTIPDPLLTKQFGVPNACNRCHADKSVDWSLGYVEQWYGDRMNRLTRTRAQAIASARLGDDSARDALLKMLQTDEIDYWRAVGANVLERWANEPAVANALVNKLTDTNALVRQNIVQTLASLGENAPPEIRDAIQQRLSDSSRSVRVVAAQAMSAELKMDSLAASEFVHMLNHNSDQPAGQVQLGVFDYARGDATNALKRFQTAAKWDPFSPGIRHETAILLSQLGRTREAAAELEEAVRLAPRDAEFRFKLALALNELGESTRVMAELEQAVKLDPRHARAAYNLGLARNAAGNPRGAIQALIAAELAEPRDPQIPYARATIHAQLGEIDQARSAASRALELNPQFVPAAQLIRQLQRQ
jgi:Flp pilus assembly protein TadD